MADGRAAERSGMRRAVVAAWLAACCGVVGAARADAQLPAPAVSSPEPLHVGGYGGVVVNTPLRAAEHNIEITEGSAAILASGTLLQHFAWFTELDAVSSTRENFAGRQDDRQLDAARLYVEATASDALRLRVGRFLTPFGAWNEEHAEPLTWTAVRPLATYRSFAKSMTGALVAGQGAVAGHDAGYALWGATDAWPRDRDEGRFTRAAGARVAIELARGVWVGASGAAMREVRPRAADDGLYDASEAGETGPDIDQDADDFIDRTTRALVGVDVRVPLGRGELTAEGTRLTALDGERSEMGGFVQGAVAVVGPLFVVGRLERFEPRVGTPLTATMLGAVVRPRGRMAIKLERQSAWPSAARVGQGWYASVSLLF